jgi:mannose-6-phosphate isomerase-like protein (cupin superfamily)
MKLIHLFLLFVAFAFSAGDPEGLHIWKSAELKGLAKALAPKLNGTSTALEQLPGAGNYSFIKIYRNGTGQAEFHETQADVFVVETGSATLVYGGKMVDAKTTAPHEMRAPSIEGGVEKKLGPGDIVSIPAKVPHQVKLDAGKDIAYFIVKVTQ